MTTSTPIEEISDDMLRDLFTTEQITPQRYMEELERRKNGGKKIEDGVMDDLSLLVGQVERLREADRNIDWLITKIVLGRSIGVPHFTSSIDAAVSLAERVMPGWDWGTKSFGEDGAQGKVWKHGWHDDTVIYADHSSPVIALVLATLRALQQKGGTE